LNGTTSLTGTNNFFWDTANNRLGIGLTNPQRSIEIFNSTADNHLRLSGNAPSVSMGEAVTGSIYQAKFGLVTVNGQFVTAGVAGDFVIISQTGATIIGTSSTEKMRVQSSGNVSINNTNDTFKLDVTGTARLTGQLRLESTITDGTYTYTLPSATGTLALTSALSGYLPLTGGTLTGALVGTSASFSSNGSSFGSASAGSYPLTIQTNVSEQSIKFIGKNDNNNIQFFDSAGTTYQAVVGTIGTNFIIGTGTSGTTRLTITSAGAATFSSTISTSGGRVTIQGTNQNAVWFNQNAGGSSTGFLVGRSYTTTDTQDFFIYDVLAAAPRLFINSSGNVGIGTTSPSTLLHMQKDQNTYTWSRIDNQANNASAYAGLQLGAYGNTWGIAIGSSSANSNALTFVIDAGGGNTEAMRIKSTRIINLSNVPSSSAGLSSGDIYKSAGVLMIV
jgi:hypothetical protein